MKLLIALSVLVAVAVALPTPADVVVIEAAAYASFDVNSTRNAGLTGFGAGTVGGAGGAVWTVWDAWALRDAVSSNDRRIVYVRGRIDLTQLFTSSPGVQLQIGSHTTVIGGDANAEIYGGGVRVRSNQNVIIQNIKFTNAVSYAPGETPSGNGFINNQVPGAFSSICAVDIDRGEHVWVDHCEFSDDPWNSAATPESSRRHNGLITLKRTSTWVTISNSIFRNHDMTILIGIDDSHTESIGYLKTTFYLNWFQGTSQRNPMVRFGEVHVLNNLYTDIRSYGIGARIGSSIYAEQNSFINCRRAWTTAASNPAGQFLDVGNRRSNSPFDSVPNQVNWRPNQHYGYSPMNAANVEAHVRRYAGTW